MAIPNAITWLLNIFGKERCLMKDDGGYRDVTQSFLGRMREVRRCPVCGEEYWEGALDFLSDEFVCPSCENGKEEE